VSAAPYFPGERQGLAHRPSLPAETRLQALGRIPDLIGAPIMVVASGEGGGAIPRIVYVNAAAAALIGRSAGELLDQPLDVLVAARTDALDFARLVDAARWRREIGLSLRLAGGAEGICLEIKGSPLRDDRSLYLLELRDVSELEALANAVRLHEIRHLALARLTSDVVYYLRVEPDCRMVIEWSAGTFAQLIGYSPAEVEALGGWTALVEPADLRLVQRRAQRLLAGEEATAEYRVRTRGGACCWLRDLGHPHWDDAHELVVGVLCVAQDVTAHRRLEKDLQAEQLERDSLLGLIDGLVCEVEAEGVLRDLSGTLRGELGARLRTGVGRPLREVLGHELAETWRRQITRVVPGAPAVSCDFVYPAAAGDERYHMRMGAAAGGKALALIRQRGVTAHEVHDVARLAGPDPRLGALLDLLPGPALLLTTDLTVQDLNSAAEWLTGWQRAAAIGRRFVELIALASEQPAVLQDLKQALGGTRVAGSEVWLRLPDGQEGRVVWSYTPLRGPGGAMLGVLAQGSTLAPLGEIASAAADDQLRLKAIMDNVADGIVVLDNQGVIVSFSRPAEAIFGYRRSEVIGRTAGMLILPGPGETGQTLDVMLGSGNVPGETRETMARRKSGEVIPIELAASHVSFNGDTLHILTVRDITLRKQTEETIRSLAYHDPLTGLPNRLLFNDRLTQAIERARRNRQQLAVMILDLDRFKLINDSLGLASGDQVLRAVGERLVGLLRRSDTVARLGGDDFLLLLPGVDGAESAAKVAQKLLDAFAYPLAIDDQELHVGASLGITLYPHDGEDTETLIRNADTALYRAKEHARGGYQFYTTDMNATAFERLVLETQLRRALERAELVVHYQPQVRLNDGKIVGVEALVRWFHADLGLIAPAEFIPLAEETGLILELGRFVLRTACAQVRAWHEAGFSNLRLAVNLSGRQFEQEDLVRDIARVVEGSAFDPADLELELTESSIMRDPEQAVAKLEALDRLGIRLSIDDFGTGYSSLLHLKRFPIKVLKIDQSFIQDITTDPDDAAIAQAIIALAESLRLKVIAEGVETRGQLELLRRYRCDQMQGYLFSKPLPAGELFELLKSGARLLH
jgi:diguanylate cyclase (GGDEF)-like protein/PAS domain S-box-containing protein